MADDIESAADGLALWEEFKPQDADDWIGTAEFWLREAGGALDEASPLFQALVKAVQQRDGCHEALRALIADVGVGNASRGTLAKINAAAFPREQGE